MANRSESPAALTTKLKGGPQAYRAEFVLVLDHVRACLESGHSVTSIYRDLRDAGEINCAYETFRRYALHYIPIHERRPRTNTRVPESHHGATRGADPTAEAAREKKEPGQASRPSAVAGDFLKRLQNPNVAKGPPVIPGPEL